MPTSTSPLQAAHHARFLPSTYDEATRAIEVVWSTGARVRRYDWWRDEYYDEELDMSAGACDLSRLAAGSAPVLDSHDRFGGLAAQIGVVERAWLTSGGEGRAKVRFSERPEVAGIVADIRAGVIQNISIGYTVQRYQIDRAEGEIPVYTAVEWQPFEISFVTVPADAAAGTRTAEASAQPGQPDRLTRCETFPNYRSHTMPQTNPQQPASRGDAPSDTVLAERSRIGAIRALSSRFGGHLANIEQITTDAIANGTAELQFRELLMAELAQADRVAGGHINRNSGADVPIERNGGITRQGGSQRREDFVEAASDALLLRAGLRLKTTHAAARDFRGMTALDIARSCLYADGRSFGDSSPREVLARAMSSSDFPYLLEATANKAMRAGAESEQTTHRRWVKVSDARDFRTQSRVILGSSPDLEEVKELGEYKFGALDEDKQTLVPKKFGRIIALSYEAILADDLGAFADHARMQGLAAMRCEADAVYDALVSNSLAGPNLSDGVSLFHTDHNNLITGGGALSATTLSDSKVKLRRQTALGGGYLNLTPRFLIVPTELEDPALVIVSATFNPATSATAVPDWVRQLEVIVEPRLSNSSASTFYLAADPAEISTAEVAVVDNAPHLEEMSEPKRDALAWKVRHAFAAGFIDFRGMVRHSS